jgi:DNA polymerase-3 subunit epsilon
MSWLTSVITTALGQSENPRWIVVDVESSGLDPNADRLLAIAAVAVQDGAVRYHDSFETVLKQEIKSSKANILLHGIGVRMQSMGLSPEQALAEFEQYVGGSPLLAFHAPFDERLLSRASKRYLGHALKGPWLDIMPLAAVLCPEVSARSLDEWLSHFSLGVATRHRAASDVIATAELLLKLLALVRQQNKGQAPTFALLKRLAAQHRWAG